MTKYSKKNVSFHFENAQIVFRFSNRGLVGDRGQRWTHPLQRMGSRGRSFLNSSKKGDSDFPHKKEELLKYKDVVCKGVTFSATF